MPIFCVVGKTGKDKDKKEAYMSTYTRTLVRYSIEYAEGGLE